MAASALAAAAIAAATAIRALDGPSGPFQTRLVSPPNRLCEVCVRARALSRFRFYNDNK